MNSKFKVIAMGRVGTLAMNRFISSHPSIHMPSFKNTTKALVTPGENIGALLLDSSQQSARQGIIIHDAQFLDKRYRRDLLKMSNIKVNSILHLVRNPFQQILSWINHINAVAYLDEYNFKKIPPSAEGLNTHYPHHFRTMLIGSQCQSFYKNYTQLKIIDFSSLQEPIIEQTMADIYDFLGVDNGYRSAMFRQEQNNYTRELLKQGIKFKLNNEVVEMIMIPEDLFFHHDENATPWVTIHDTAEIYKLCPTLPALEGDLIFLPKNILAANKLSYKTRKMLHEGIADIVSEVVPVWAKNAEQIAQRIEAEKLLGLSDSDREYALKVMKDDLNIFYRYHPEFKAIWEL